MAARKLVRHGTRGGYDKHYRVRKGDWRWPINEEKCNCAKAYRAYQADYTTREGTRLGMRQRSLARQRAYQILKNLYPRDYQKFYLQELSIIQNGGQVTLDELLAEMRRVSSVKTEQQLSLLIRDGTATVQERNIYWKIHHLRIRVAEEEARVRASQEREPDGAG